MIKISMKCMGSMTIDDFTTVFFGRPIIGCHSA